jgi:hypothetical protein
MDPLLLNEKTRWQQCLDAFRDPLLGCSARITLFVSFPFRITERDGIAPITLFLVNG